VREGDSAWTANPRNSATQRQSERCSAERPAAGAKAARKNRRERAQPAQATLGRPAANPEPASVERRHEVIASLWRVAEEQTQALEGRRGAPIPSSELKALVDGPRGALMRRRDVGRGRRLRPGFTPNSGLGGLEAGSGFSRERGARPRSDRPVLDGTGYSDIGLRGPMSTIPPSCKIRLAKKGNPCL
jgi:hypothetical protein